MQDQSLREQLKGFMKIKSFCGQAHSDGFQYVWVCWISHFVNDIL
jgi:hypothetical protein